MSDKFDTSGLAGSVDRIAEKLAEDFIGPQEPSDEGSPARRLPRKEVRKAAKQAGTTGQGIRWERLDEDGNVEASAVYPGGLLAWIRGGSVGWTERSAFSPADFPMADVQVMVQGVGYFGRVRVQLERGRLVLVEQ